MPSPSVTPQSAGCRGSAVLPPVDSLWPDLFPGTTGDTRSHTQAWPQPPEAGYLGTSSGVQGTGGARARLGLPAASLQSSHRAPPAWLAAPGTP